MHRFLARSIGPAAKIFRRPHKKNAVTEVVYHAGPNNTVFGSSFNLRQPIFRSMRQIIFWLSAATFIIVAIMRITDPIVPIIVADFELTVGTASIIVFFAGGAFIGAFLHEQFSPGRSHTIGGSYT